MSLFKDLKDDMSQAVNELMNDDAGAAVAENEDLDAELADLFGEVEEVEEGESDADSVADTQDEEKDSKNAADLLKEYADGDDTKLSDMEVTLEEAVGDTAAFAPEAEASVTNEQSTENINQEEDIMAKEAVEEVKEEVKAEVKADTVMEEGPADDETATITKGTEIIGNIKTTGSLDVIGTIEGDVSCRGKLTVSGSIRGKSEAAEIFTDAANITGDMVSNGSIKVGGSSVVVGNIKASSAVVAGAVKGDIDVDGPVIIDSTAVVMGNIKSRSVQVNNGAVMEGMCSQSYSDIDVNTFFDN